MTSLTSLTSMLRCPRCLGTDWSTSGDQRHGTIACRGCGATFACRDYVLDLDAGSDTRAVSLEREGVHRTERVPELGGINDEFDDLSRAQGPLRDAILALPYGDGSRYYREPGYFSNVALSAPAFDFVVRHLNVSAGERLLDVGADLTWSTSQMARRGLDCTALDINHHLPVGRLFAEEFSAPYHLIRGDISRASFRTDCFDAVIALNALHHAVDLEAAAGNIGRMLRPGGRLGFVEPYCATEEAKAAFGRAQIDAGISEQTYLLPEWHLAMLKAGLRVCVLRVADSFAAVYDKVPGDGSDLFERFYSGTAALADEPLRQIPRGETVNVRLVLENRGDAVWTSSSQFPVLASYHLHRRTGPDTVLVAFDNPRTRLPHEIGPGEQANATVQLAPLEPGQYVVELDLVHEYVAWFRSKGMRLPTLDVRVV
jgi:SAM-dependent methyltransferase